MVVIGVSFEEEEEEEIAPSLSNLESRSLSFHRIGSDKNLLSDSPLFVFGNSVTDSSVGNWEVRNGTRAVTE
jgi:hypothetical protein